MKGEAMSELSPARWAYLKQLRPSRGTQWRDKEVAQLYYNGKSPAPSWDGIKAHLLRNRPSSTGEQIRQRGQCN